METEDCSAARHCSGKIMQSWIKKNDQKIKRGQQQLGSFHSPFLANELQCMAKRRRSTIYIISLVRQAWVWWDEGQAKICRWKNGVMHVRLDQKLEMHSCTHASSFWVDNTDPYRMNAGYQESATDCKFIEWIFNTLNCNSLCIGTDICISSN